MEQKVTLNFGYEGRPGGPIRDLVVGRRVTGADLLRINDEGDGQAGIQFQLAVLASAITEFGDFKMPVPPNVMLSLKRPDRRLIAKGYDALVRESSGGRKAQKLAPGRYRLERGFEFGETLYDVVEFGNHLSGFDELEADEMSGFREVFFLLGKEITRLSQSEGAATKSGPLAVEDFETLYAEDAFALQRYEADWYDSFRPAETDAAPAGTAIGGGASDDAPSPAGRDGAGVE